MLEQLRREQVAGRRWDVKPRHTSGPFCLKYKQRERRTSSISRIKLTIRVTFKIGTAFLARPFIPINVSPLLQMDRVNLRRRLAVQKFALVSRRRQESNLLPIFPLTSCGAETMHNSLAMTFPLSSLVFSSSSFSPLLSCCTFIGTLKEL